MYVCIHIYIYIYLFMYIISVFKTLLKHRTKQFFQGVVHEPAWSSIAWLFQGSSNVSIFVWDSFFWYVFLLFGVFVCVLYFHCLFLELFEMVNFPKYMTSLWNLMKTLHPNNFQGSSPWASLILNSMIVPGIFYCVQFFLKCTVSDNIFLLSFAIVFVS